MLVFPSPPLSYDSLGDCHSDIPSTHGQCLTSSDLVARPGKRACSVGSLGSLVVRLPSVTPVSRHLPPCSLLALPFTFISYPNYEPHEGQGLKKLCILKAHSHKINKCWSNKRMNGGMRLYTDLSRGMELKIARFQKGGNRSPDGRLITCLDRREVWSMSLWWLVARLLSPAAALGPYSWPEGPSSPLRGH